VGSLVESYRFFVARAGANLSLGLPVLINQLNALVTLGTEIFRVRITWREAERPLVVPVFVLQAEAFPPLAALGVLFATRLAKRFGRLHAFTCLQVANEAERTPEGGSASLGNALTRLALLRARLAVHVHVAARLTHVGLQVAVRLRLRTIIRVDAPTRNGATALDTLLTFRARIVDRVAGLLASESRADHLVGALIVLLAALRTNLVVVTDEGELTIGVLFALAQGHATGPSGHTLRILKAEHAQILAGISWRAACIAQAGSAAVAAAGDKIKTVRTFHLALVPCGHTLAGHGVAQMLTRAWGA